MIVKDRPGRIGKVLDIHTAMIRGLKISLLAHVFFFSLDVFIVVQGWTRPDDINSNWYKHLQTAYVAICYK